MVSNVSLNTSNLYFEDNGNSALTPQETGNLYEQSIHEQENSSSIMPDTEMPYDANSGCMDEQINIENSDNEETEETDASVTVDDYDKYTEIEAGITKIQNVLFPNRFLDQANNNNELNRFIAEQIYFNQHHENKNNESYNKIDKIIEEHDTFMEKNLNLDPNVEITTELMYLLMHERNRLEELYTLTHPEYKQYCEIKHSKSPFGCLFQN